MRAFQKSIRHYFGKITIALIGTVSVIGHYVVYRQTQFEIKETVKSVSQEQLNPIRDEMSRSNLELERRFASKPDVEKIVMRIETLNEQIENMREQVAELEGFLKGRDRIRTKLFWGKR